jgi:tetratricopeptide (TPR) repeat protein
MKRWIVCAGLSAIAVLPLGHVRSAIAQVPAMPAPPRSSYPILSPNHPINVIPADAAGVMLVSTKASDWQKLSRFNSFPADFSTPSLLFGEAIGSGLNFHMEIEPWLGEQLAGVLLSNGAWLTIAPVKQPDLIPEFLARLEQVQDKAPQVVRHQGVTIRYWLPEKIELPNLEGIGAAEKPAEKPAEQAMKLPEIKPLEKPGWAIAYLPSGYIIQAEKPETLQAIIDQGAMPKLTSNLTWQAAQNHPKYQDSIVFVFGDYKHLLNLPQPKDASEEWTKGLPEPFRAVFTPPDPQTLAKLGEQFGGFTGLAWVEPTGIQMFADMELKQPLPSQVTINYPNPKILEYVPAVSYMTLVGHSTGQLFFDPTGGADKNWQTILGFLRGGSQGLLGIDDRDITPWMDKELAFFTFPTQQGLLPGAFKVDLGFGSVIQTSDRAKATATLKKVEQHLVKQAGKKNPIQAKTQMLKGVSVTSLELTNSNRKTPSQTLFAYSWVTPDTLMMLSGADPQMLPKPWQNLTTAPNFQQAIAPLPQENIGYFYVNGSATTAFIFNSLIPVFAGPEFAKDNFVNEIKGSFGGIRSLAGTATYKPGRVESHGFMLMTAARRSPLSAAIDWTAAGEQRMAEKNWDWAVANFSNAIALDVQNPSLYLSRGKALIEQKYAVSGIRDLNRALSLNPGKPLMQEAVNQRGRGYLFSYDYINATKDLSQSINDRIDLPFNYLARSTAAIATEDYQQAIADATKAIQQGQTSFGYVNRCYAKAKLGDFKAAAEDCRKIEDIEGLSIASIPELSDVRFLAQDCYVQAGLAPAEGLPYNCELAMIGGENDPYVQENQGLAYTLLTGDSQSKEKAKQAFEKAIVLFGKQRNQTGVERVKRSLAKLS